MGYLQVSLVVLSDLCYDETRVGASDHPPGTQLELQRHSDSQTTDTEREEHRPNATRTQSFLDVTVVYDV